VFFAQVSYSTGSHNVWTLSGSCWAVNGTGRHWQRAGDLRHLGLGCAWKKAIDSDSPPRMQ
jgi:hypothetical protein